MLLELRVIKTTYVYGCNDALLIRRDFDFYLFLGLFRGLDLRIVEHVQPGSQVVVMHPASDLLRNFNFSVFIRKLNRFSSKET